ncbi:hypothetical protein vB_PsyM_KIL3b_0119 [Pseudomonas phage vB_PsyM_KIL3b]|uniref:Uncharacterized protein n=6 Tax=Flaumdravirus TaxID=2560133 RepID=A0A142IF40_9CAUD|nr:hypothetical protein BH774_gp084 [Pseudomonas phage vB_PsyM_KIL1]YP_009616798.1 hypothetical protein FDI83_gp092 [Pseudomonas phage vB_PsyM_KIL4]AMR57524.1 hypothetical protein vB_PsyM_KIL2_0124 [Pseudomonas phage vB_PsyM_KIL2]AMR57686.1 hypothetical protein vB_PsyM_KIL3_0119 [Pseudomonas phage vB_PsyM_KIL3]AMR58017.1 hypothetical protein vB_PsyM_KIL5_0126 [Pseudomonas phage vB_PsyM_KIL5]AMR58184.1 hypothetical protein vB_PsyM_KIL3b_0119 [Pseudomonas phage vB_PsyM_KIL3b]AMR57365.1 hypothet
MSDKLSLEQAELAFSILALMIEKFPDNPELTVAPLEIVYNATKQSVEEAE